MNVLHIVPTYLPAMRYGGPIYSVHGLCKALASRGHHVEVYTTNVDGSGDSDVPLERKVCLDGVNVTYFATGRGRRLYRSPAMAASLARNVNLFDLVHIHSVFLWPTLAGAAAARAAAVPYVLSPRGMLVPELIQRKSKRLKSAWIRLFERRNIAEAASIHVTTELEGEDLRRLGLTARRIAVIPNGVDLPPESGMSSKESPRGSTDSPVVLCLGRITWKKGLDRLVVAMAKVPAARLVIVGSDDENYVPKLEALIAKCGIGDRTEILGPVSGAAKWEVFASADVFALASHSENFGMVVLEAMACGIPVVVTPEVGLARVVQKAGAGLVVQGYPDQLGEALQRLVADRELRLRMGAAGRATAAERFTWSVVARRMETLYQELISQASPGQQIIG